MNSSPLALSRMVLRTLYVKMCWPASSDAIVKNVTAYASGPVLRHCPYPGLSCAEPNETEEMFVRPPSALKVPSPTNAGTEVGVTVFDQAPTSVLPPLGVP